MEDEPTRAKIRLPRPAGTLHRGVSAFRPSDGALLLAVVPLTPRKSAAWLAEAMNDALQNYLATFAVNHPSPSAEQEEWARKLRMLADECLDMIAPGFSPNYPPRQTASSVYSALFHNGPPQGIKEAHLRWLGFDNGGDALNKLPEMLWLLRSFAANAEKGWNGQKLDAGDMKRKEVRYALLCWVADLGRIYAHLYGRLPTYSTYSSKDGVAQASFVMFADAARRRAIEANEHVSEGGTDYAAYLDLKGFDAPKCARFAKSHAAKLKPRWREGLQGEVVPDRIRLGIRSENAPDASAGD